MLNSDMSYFGILKRLIVRTHCFAFSPKICGNEFNSAHKLAGILGMIIACTFPIQRLTTDYTCALMIFVMLQELQVAKNENS